MVKTSLTRLMAMLGEDWLAVGLGPLLQEGATKKGPI